MFQDYQSKINRHDEFFFLFQTWNTDRSLSPVVTIKPFLHFAVKCQHRLCAYRITIGERRCRRMGNVDSKKNARCALFVKSKKNGKEYLFTTWQDIDIYENTKQGTNTYRRRFGTPRRRRFYQQTEIDRPSALCRDQQQILGFSSFIKEEVWDSPGSYGWRFWCCTRPRSNRVGWSRQRSQTRRHTTIQTNR